MRPRLWLAAALAVSCVVGGCGTSESSAPLAASSPAAATAKPTPGGPTPSLPLAKPVASPSPAAAGAQQPSAAGFQTFALQSAAFSDGSTLPPDFTCDGAGQSPPLTWTGAPPGTAAYALIEQDADAKNDGQPFTQWLVYNMPRAVTQLTAGVPASPLLSNGSQQGTNDAHSIGYLGACPDQGQPAHHLTFELFAQDGYVTLETGAAYPDVHDALMGHTIAQTQLTAVVQR